MEIIEKKYSQEKIVIEIDISHFPEIPTAATSSSLFAFEEFNATEEGIKLRERLFEIIDKLDNKVEISIILKNASFKIDDGQGNYLSLNFGTIYLTNGMKNTYTWGNTTELSVEVSNNYFITIGSRTMIVEMKLQFIRELEDNTNVLHLLVYGEPMIID